MKTKISLFFFLYLIIGISTSNGQDKLMDILRDELKNRMQELKTKELPVYHLSYRVKDTYSTSIVSSFGAIETSQRTHSCTFIPQIRLGDKNFDNFKYRDMGMKKQGRNGYMSVAYLPVDGKINEAAIRQAIWKETLSRYQFAVNAFQNDKSNMSLNTESKDRAACFSDAPVEKYYEAPLPEEKKSIDVELWKKKLNRISAEFKTESKILKGSANLNFDVERSYFLNNEGTEIIQNFSRARMIIEASAKADDGMEIPLNVVYFAYEAENLPDESKIVADVKDMIAQIVTLREAPLADPYSGPVLMSGKSSGVFFHEIFGHRVEGQRMKRDSDGQTFKSMLGKGLLPESIQVYCDPSITSYVGCDLNGSYKYDDQGVKSRRVDIIKDGKLNEFLMTRIPIDGLPKSNGHARSSGGYDPVSRQSNLIVETKEDLDEEKLRKLFLEEVKRQGKEFGYYFKSVTSGFTLTDAKSISSFNVTPLEVYQVFVDGSPDRLVRGVDLIGTPLSMFSNISNAGGKTEIFTGMCGAESGWIPVTAISPSILVNKVEMQRRAVSKVIPPILSRP